MVSVCPYPSMTKQPKTARVKSRTSRDTGADPVTRSRSCSSLLPFPSYPAAETVSDFLEQEVVDERVVADDKTENSPLRDSSSTS